LVYGPSTKLEAKQEVYEQEFKIVQAKLQAVSKEIDKANTRFGELDVSFQKTVEKQKKLISEIL